ncbi:MAG: inositol-3-phosphate synthase [Candidatus Peribacteraceae bacterium]|nr:inositol-3-phosphate synthase [Candidatus Peribacteraceae bacterium]
MSIRVGIVGVGNCASALIQGVNHYRDQDSAEIPGVMHAIIGGYKIKDIEFVAAFDIDKRKVGLPLREAMFAKPNCCRTFCTDIKDNCHVRRGAQLDGISDHMIGYHEDINFDPVPPNPMLTLDDIRNGTIRVLREERVDVLLNYLPVGSQEATEFYANCAIAAGVPFLNCIPVFIASNPYWEKKFIDANLPLIGDDMKSQVGASILSQVFQELLFDRGHEVDFHSQLNVGGNTDFANMMNADRLASKKISKENVIRCQNDIRGIPVPKDGIFAGPSSFIPYQKDNKVAHFRIEARGFGGAPVMIDARLSVQDSENSAGVVIDALRYLKVAHEMGIVGSLRGPSAWTQKSPVEQLTYQEAKMECDALARRELTDRTRAQVSFKQPGD